MRTITAIAVLALFSIPAAAQFQVDVPPEEMRRLMKSPAIGDLAVGEVGLTAYPRFCTSDDGVRIYSRHGLLEESSDYGITYRVRREPGGMVSLTSVVGAKSSSKPDDAIAKSFTDPVPCASMWFPLSDSIQVKSIDGKTRLRDFVTQVP